MRNARCVATGDPPFFINSSIIKAWCSSNHVIVYTKKGMYTAVRRRAPHHCTHSSPEAMPLPNRGVLSAASCINKCPVLTYLLYYLLTYLLTPWCRVLLEKLTGLQLVKKFPVFQGTWTFITAFTSVPHLSLSWVSPIQSIYPHPNYWRSIIILSTHLCLGLPSGHLPSGFPTKTLYTPLSPPIRATCPSALYLPPVIYATFGIFWYLAKWNSGRF